MKRRDSYVTPPSEAVSKTPTKEETLRKRLDEAHAQRNQVVRDVIDAFGLDYTEEEIPNHLALIYKRTVDFPDFERDVATAAEEVRKERDEIRHKEAVSLARQRLGVKR